MSTVGTELFGDLPVLDEDAGGGDPLDCPVCGKHCNSAAGRAAHIRMVHDKTQRPPVNHRHAQKLGAGGKSSPREAGPTSAPPRPKTRLRDWLTGPRPIKDGTVVPKVKKERAARGGGRTSLAPAGSALWGLAAMGAAKAGDPAVSTALAIQAPMAGGVLDRAIKGTFLDKLVQPMVGEADRYAEIGSLLAFPLVVGMVERQPGNPMLTTILDMLIEQNLLALAEAVVVKEQKAAKLENVGAKLSELGMDLGPDPIAGVKAILFPQFTQPPQEVPVQ